MVQGTALLLWVGAGSWIRAQLKLDQRVMNGALLQSWRACKGSKENTRGYTCGLWLLFHSLSGRVEPRETGGALWLTTVKYTAPSLFVLLVTRTASGQEGWC